MGVRRIWFPFTCLFVVLMFLGPLEPPPAHSSAPGGGRLPRPEAPPEGEARPEALPGPCRVCGIADRLGLRPVPLARPEVYRCPPPAQPLRATFPRGRVRPGDVAHVRVDADETLFDVPALAGRTRLALRFETGEARLGSVTLDLDRMGFTQEIALDDDLRARLDGVRGRVTWGRADLGADQAVAAFWIDPPDGRERLRLAGVAARLEREDAWVRDVVLGYAELEAGFHTAALARARTALARKPYEPHAAALAWHVYASLELEGLHEAAATRHLVRRLMPHGGWPEPATDGCRLRDPPWALPAGRRSHPCGGCGP